MPLLPYWDLIAGSEARAAAVVYFETWDLRSLIGVLRAAEDAASPVMVGFNGAYMPAVCGGDLRWLRAYARAALEAVEASRAQAALLFNESPEYDWVCAAVECGFNAVMYTNESLAYPKRVERIAALVKRAHAAGVAVEAELGELPDSPQSGPSAVPNTTDPDEAERFIGETGADALGVSVGNSHSPKGEPASLDTRLIGELSRRLKIPLVLHAGSNVPAGSLREGIRAGIRRINIGRAVKEPAFHSIAERAGCGGAVYPGYASLGSGRKIDILGGVESAVYEGTRRKLELLKNSTDR
jgi:fructose/tagatose bisphosphate aldolase